MMTSRWCAEIGSGNGIIFIVSNIFPFGLIIMPRMRDKAVPCMYSAHPTSSCVTTQFVARLFFKNMFEFSITWPPRSSLKFC